MNRANLAMMVCLVAFGTCVLAQDGPPDGRPVKGLAPGMAWKVEALPGDQQTSVPAEGTEAARTPAAPAAESIVLVETNVMGVNFRHQTTETPPGRRQTRLFQDGIFFIPSPDGATFSVDFPNEELAGSMVNPKRLTEFDWVGPEWWVATAVVDGVKCDIYRQPWPQPEPDEDSEPPVVGKSARLAAIGREDRFPRRLESPYRVLRYVPLPSVTPPTLPAGAVAASREFEKKIERQENRFRIPQ